MATIEIFPADDIFPAFLAGIKPCDIIMHKVYCVKLIIYSQESYRFNRSSKIYRQVWQQKVRYNANQNTAATITTITNTTTTTTDDPTAPKQRCVGTGRGAPGIARKCVVTVRQKRRRCQKGMANAPAPPPTLPPMPPPTQPQTLPPTPHTQTPPPTRGNFPKDTTGAGQLITLHYNSKS